MMIHALRISPLIAFLLVGACTTMPTGPSVLVLPGTGKTFDQFRVDDFECRQFASGQVGGATAGQAQTDSTLRSAALGTAVGAVAGAAMDGRSGAGVGAGTGLLIGTLAGTGAGDASGYSLQRRYDFGYQQCMYAKGHKIPISGRLMTPPPPGAGATPPGPPPPPPPGAR